RRAVHDGRAGTAGTRRLLGKRGFRSHAPCMRTPVPAAQAAPGWPTGQDRTLSTEAAANDRARRRSSERHPPRRPAATPAHDRDGANAPEHRRGGRLQNPPRPRVQRRGRGYRTRPGALFATWRRNRSGPIFTTGSPSRGWGAVHREVPVPSVHLTMGPLIHPPLASSLYERALRSQCRHGTSRRIVQFNHRRYAGSTKTFDGEKTIDSRIGTALCPAHKDEAAKRFKGGALMMTPDARGPPRALLSAAPSTCKRRHKSSRFPAERSR